MTPVGLGDPLFEDCDPVVRKVVEETRAAVEEIMKELNDMVGQSTQTPPPPPQFTMTNVYDNVEALAEAQDPIPPPPEEDHERLKRRPRPPPSSVDYMVCPCHDVRLEARQYQKGWHYVKCPIQPCLLFCGQDQAPDYMKAVYCQPRRFKEAVLPMIRANTPTSSFDGKATISPLTTRMSAILKTTRPPWPSTPSWLARWDGYVKSVVA